MIRDINNTIVIDVGEYMLTIDFMDALAYFGIADAETYYPVLAGIYHLYVKGLYSPANANNIIE